MAAILCGYDPCSPVEAQTARADYRVWDLVGVLTPKGADR
jgi:hypothetical protein